MTIQDDLTKFIKFCAIKDCTAEEIGKALMEEWILCYGLPNELLSDNGSNLCGEVMTQLARYCGISRITTSIAHPQSNASVERAHARLAEFIRTTDAELEVDTQWGMKLKMASYCYNTTPHTTTGYSPHHLMFGQPPRLISSVYYDEYFATPENYVTKMQKIHKEIWEKARASTIKAKEKAGEREANGVEKRKIDEFKPGQLILIETRIFKGKTNRKCDTWMGPYEIAEVNEHTVGIKKRNRITIVNKSNCKPYLC